MDIKQQFGQSNGLNFSSTKNKRRPNPLGFDINSELQSEAHIMLFIQNNRLLSFIFPTIIILHIFNCNCAIRNSIQINKQTNKKHTAHCNIIIIIMMNHLVLLNYNKVYIQVTKKKAIDCVFLFIFDETKLYSRFLIQTMLQFYYYFYLTNCKLTGTEMVY